MMKKIAIATAFTFASLTAAMAADHITVKANRTSGISSYVHYNRDLCSGGAIPHLRVGRKPKHGKLTFKTIVTKLGPGPCKGTRVKAAAAYYTPDRGFRGEDSFSVSYKHDIYEGAAGVASTSYSYRVTVK